MYKVKLSPYRKIFYTEWQLAPLSSKYNIVFDQTISETLDILRLENSLSKFIADYFIFNSHVIHTAQELYWITNERVTSL